MAKKSKKIAADESNLLGLIRKRFAKGIEADRHNRETAKEEMNFAYVPGSQWPKELAAQYKLEGRPCLEINRMPAFIGQVIGDQRQARPSAKVHPVDSDGDPEVAEIIEGLIRNIEAISNADVAYDKAFEHTTSGGFGYWRIITDWLEGSFDQEILIKPIHNNFSVVWDPAALEYDKSDANWVIVSETISKDTYEQKYNGKVPSNIDMPDGTYLDWFSTDTVRIAEYFYKEYYSYDIYLLESGEIVREVQEGQQVAIHPKTGEPYRRKVDDYKIMRLKVDGNNILEPAQEWPSKYWSIVPVIGKTINIDGIIYVWGLIHYALDAQRTYNFSRSREVETVALSPLAPYIGTATQIGPYKAIWDQAHKKTYAWLPYQADPAAPGPPQRAIPPQTSSAITESVMMAVDEMKSTIGLFNDSLGQQSNAESGKAINARQREGDVGTFPFIDNLARSRALTYKVLIDLIPKIYDSKRIIRILGLDGSPKTVEINKPAIVEDEKGQMINKVLNDLTVGKYDVTVTMGPSYTTQRMEAADSLMKFIAAAPQTAPILGDLVAKSMDWPLAQEAHRRLKAVVPPEVLTEEERQERQKNMGPQQAPPTPPDPRMIDVQAKIAEAAERLRMDSEKHVLELDKMKAEIQNILASGVKSVAQAEALEIGQQLEQYRLGLEGLSVQFDMMQKQLMQQQQQPAQDQQQLIAQGEY